MPYLNLVRNGFPKKLLLDQVLTKLEKYSYNFLKISKQKLCEYFLKALGYEEESFKIGEKHVFFRPDKDTLLAQMELSKLSYLKEMIDSQIFYDNWRAVVKSIIILEPKFTSKIFNEQLTAESINLPEHVKISTIGKFANVLCSKKCLKLLINIISTFRRYI